MDMRDAEREFLISVINTIPNDLEVEDVPDLFTIVEQHYVSRTPSVKVTMSISFYVKKF